jgi:hypothetical protein
MGDADYLFAFQHVVMPVAYDFNPDFVISELLLGLPPFEGCSLD